MTVSSTPLNPKILSLLGAIVTTQVLGDIWLSRGMKVFGAVTSYHWSALVTLLVYLFTSPWIWLGVATLICSMFLYMAAVSRLDLSLVLPLLASSYQLNACLAWLILQERISPLRWLATLLIALGVYAVFHSERKRQQVASIHPEVAAVRSPVPSSKLPGSSSFWLGFPLGLYLSKVWAGIIILVLADSTGDLLLTQGMKRIGPVPLNSPRAILRFIGQVLSHPLVLSGIAFQAIAFGCFISLLSWADISLVRPATALGYGASLLGARFILRERIPPNAGLVFPLLGGGIVDFPGRLESLTMTQTLITTSPTAEEYLALEIEADTRSEYRNGEIIAMTGGTPAHNEIALVFSALLWLNLRGQNYSVFGADQRLWVPEHNLYTYPDVMVITRPLQLQPGRKDTIMNPLLIVEVLSKSTKDYDRGDKFLAYRTLPTLQEYILVDQYQPQVEQYVKQSAHQWLLTEYQEQAAVLTLASVPVNIPLSDLYSNLEEN